MCDQTFIWTEVYNCGIIGKVAIESFLTHHQCQVHVFGFSDDLAHIDDDPRVVKVVINSKVDHLPLLKFFDLIGIGRFATYERYLRKGFSRGHLGTARLWAYILSERVESKFIHFDSDVIFLGPLVSRIDEMLRTSDLVGPVRAYRGNQNGRDDVRDRPDVCQTCCFGFNRDLFDSHSHNELTKMILGSYDPTGEPVLDFFDPVMFEILKNGGRLMHLPHDVVGGINTSGSRVNRYHFINDYNAPFKIDFGSEFVHFSGVGSGKHYYDLGYASSQSAYVQYAIDRYALYMSVFFKADIGVNLDVYSEQIRYLECINKDSWTLVAG